MERFKSAWRPIVTGFGISALAIFTYFFYRKFFKKKRLNKNKAKLLSSLTKDEAMRRSAIVKNLKYTLFLQLNPGSYIASKNTYEGSILIEFDMNKLADIFIDFKGQIKSLIINSEQVEISHSNERIFINSKNLIENSNKVHITYINQYAASCYGITHIYDQADMVIIN